VLVGCGVDVAVIAVAVVAVVAVVGFVSLDVG
jgi:hypothetical protein